MEFVCMCVVVVVVVVVLWGVDPYHSLSGGHTQYVSYTKFKSISCKLYSGDENREIRVHYHDNNHCDI